MATLKSRRKQQAEIENLVKDSTPKDEKKSTKRKPKKTPEAGTAVTPVETPVEENVPVEDIPTSPYMNEAEQKALAEQHEKDTEDSKKVSIDKMEEAVRVASENFNLLDKGFSVNGFADKGSKVQLSVSNGDFDLVITIKDAEKFGIL